MFRQPLPSGDDFHFHTVCGIPAILGDKPPDGIQVFGGLRSELKRRIHLTRIESLGPTLPQYVDCGVSVDQFAPLSLREAFPDLGCDDVALFEHPVFQIELLAKDLKSLIENLGGIPIRPGLNGQVDDALLLRLQVD